MELGTYFRINAADTGRTVLEGWTTPMCDENQLHAEVVELNAQRTPR